MSNKNEEVLSNLLKALEKEKQRSRLFSWLELAGFIILIAGFVYLFTGFSKLKHERAELEASIGDFEIQVADFEQKEKDANAEIESEQASLAKFSKKISAAIEFIDNNNVSEARQLLGLAETDYDEKQSKDVLKVNSLGVGNKLEQTSNTPKAGRVYAWAYVNSPTTQQITMRLLANDESKSELFSRSFDIGINTDKGYRVYAYKTLPKGSYVLEIRDQGNNTLKAIDFQVN